MPACGRFVCSKSADNRHDSFPVCLHLQADKTTGRRHFWDDKLTFYDSLLFPFESWLTAGRCCIEDTTGFLLFMVTPGHRKHGARHTHCAYDLTASVALAAIT
nr:hypothetical protein [Pandoravirus massiliensis]